MIGYMARTPIIIIQQIARSLAQEGVRTPHTYNYSSKNRSLAIFFKIARYSQLASDLNNRSLAIFISKSLVA